MGRCLAVPYGTWSLVTGAESVTHQCAGVDGSPVGTPPFPARVTGSSCTGADRQHNGGVLHKSPRRCEIGTTAECGSRAVGVGRATASQLAGSLLPRNQQCGCGPAVARRATARGMDVTPGGGEENLAEVWTGISGPVRDGGDGSLSPMVLSSSRARVNGQRCAGSGVATGTPVCVSTIDADGSNASASEGRGSQGFTGGSILASETLVPAVVPAEPGEALAPSGAQGPVEADGGSDMAPTSATSAAGGLAIGPGRMKCHSLPANVLDTILQSRAEGTRQQYATRWNYFEAWCTDQKEEPTTCSLQTVLSFLQMLLEKGRKLSTLRGYVAALSLYHNAIEGRSLGSHQLVGQFLRGARRKLPRSNMRTPMWDLKIVLEALAHPPFEPMASADLKWVSLKTAFLLAITSAKRVSELHALSVSADCVRWHPGGESVELWPNPAFLPKVLPLTHVNRPITLVRWPENETICPLRALRLYLTATQSLRRTEQLFVCHGQLKRGLALTKQRLAHWIVGAISAAYEGAGIPLAGRVTAHTTRGVATSWAALRGVSLQDICAAATWTSDTTFARYYRLNVAQPPPLGAAVQAVGLTSKN